MFQKLSYNFVLTKYAKKNPIKEWKFVKGDNVVVTAGKDKGKQGKILKVNKKTQDMVVENVNIETKLYRKNFETGEKGGEKEVTMPISYDKVKLIDPATNKPTRIKYAINENGKRVRVAKSGAIIEKPLRPEMKKEERVKNVVDGGLDTSPAKTIEITYKGEDFAKVKQEFEEFIIQKEEIEKYLVFKE